MSASTVVLAAHTTAAPSWTCDACREPWPCPAWTDQPTDPARRADLLPDFSRLARLAIRDLRGREDGPRPAEIVKRFLWFLPLTDEEARAVALRLR